MTRKSTSSPDRNSEISDDLLQFEFAWDGSEEILYVTGELDVSTAPALEHAVARTLDGQSGEYHLDIGGMTFIDSSGANALLRLHQRLANLGRPLVVVAPSPQAVQVLATRRLDQVLDVRR